jgi:hypothetical protein
MSNADRRDLDDMRVSLERRGADTATIRDMLRSFAMGMLHLSADVIDNYLFQHNLLP